MSDTDQNSNSLPDRERPIHENPELRESVERGIAQVEAGDVVDLGSFQQYLNDDD